MPTYAALFAGKEYGDRLCKRFGVLNQDVKGYLAGGIGGIISTLVSCPTELLKVRSQSNSANKTNYLRTARNLFKTHGFYGGIYKGYLATLIRDIPSYAVYFGFFEMCCHHFIKSTDPAWKGLMLQIIFGSLSGVFAWISSYPYDIIKSVIQTSDSRMTIRQAIAKGYKIDGIKFFFKGMGATCVRAVPMECTCLVLYAQLRQRL